MLLASGSGYNVVWEAGGIRQGLVRLSGNMKSLQKKENTSARHGRAGNIPSYIDLCPALCHALCYCEDLMGNMLVPIILTKDEDRTESTEWFGIQGSIRFLPIWKWLLMVPEKTPGELSGSTGRKKEPAKN